MAILEFDARFQYASGFRLERSVIVDEPVTAIVGPSGSGKTTFLHLVAGLLRPLSGRITLHDRPIFDSQKNIHIPPEYRHIGYVFQDYQLFPHMTVEQNLRYGQRRRDTASIPWQQVIDVLRLADLRSRFPQSLSGGQKQRVAVGRALLSSPKILLLDEPLSAIDVQHRKEVLAFLSEVVAEFQIPAILVSHDRESVASLARAEIAFESA